MSINIDLIRESFEQAKPIANKVVDKFYKTLFSDHPEAKPLFKSTNMTAQKKALINSLVYIVDHLDNPEELEDYLHKMGNRHVDYGTEEEHYEWVGVALLKTFAHFFGDDWTEELNNEWAQAYGIIADVMKEGANHGRHGEVVNLHPQNWDIKLPDNVRQEIRTAVKQAISKAVEDEIRAAVEEELSNLGNQYLQQLRKTGT